MGDGANRTRIMSLERGCGILLHRLTGPAHRPRVEGADAASQAGLQSSAKGHEMALNHYVTLGDGKTKMCEACYVD